MKKQGFNGRAIYNPSGKAGEYSKWACNFYTGCINDCNYCYCKRGFFGRLWDNKPQLKKCFKDKDDALMIYEKELKQNLEALRHDGLFFTFTSDPFLPGHEEVYVAAIQMAFENGVCVQTLSKRSEFAFNNQFHDVFAKHQGMIAFGFTLTGHDELEPGASTNQERIQAMIHLHKQGFKTFASIEPVVDFESSYRMIQSTIGCCDLYKIGLMSGGSVKYNQSDCIAFVGKVHEAIWKDTNRSRVYWKESVRKLVGDELTSPSCPIVVGCDYNIFN